MTLNLYTKQIKEKAKQSMKQNIDTLLGFFCSKCQLFSQVHRWANIEKILWLYSSNMNYYNLSVNSTAYFLSFLVEKMTVPLSCT